jgi:hypothetical protein
MRIQPAGGNERTGAFYMLLASTLKRMPLGLKPFGSPREGLKTLAIAAPPRRILRMTRAILAGSQTDWLESNGCRREDHERLAVSLGSGFVLDGELYAGGEFVLENGPAIEFLVP